MRKLIALTGLALTLASGAQADTILGLRAGGGIWDTSSTGTVGPDLIDVEGELGLEDTNQNYYYASIEHPVPMVPNIRLSHTELKIDGTGELDSIARLESVELSPGLPVTTNIDLSHTDLTLYYELLDNVVEVDFGLTFRQFDSTLTMRTTLISEVESVTVDGVVPMVHLAGAFNLPFSGLSAYASVDTLSVGDYNMTDTKAEIIFATDLTPVLTLNLKAGYRTLDLELEEADDISADVDFSGPYAGFELYF